MLQLKRYKAPFFKLAANSHSMQRLENDLNLPKYVNSIYHFFWYSIKMRGESAASFFRQVAALFPDMFCDFYLVKNHKIVKNSTATKAKEKISTDLES
jgi:hypothetical protein